MEFLLIAKDKSSEHAKKLQTDYVVSNEVYADGRLETSIHSLTSPWRWFVGNQSIEQLLTNPTVSITRAFPWIHWSVIGKLAPPLVLI